MNRKQSKMLNGMLKTKKEKKRWRTLSAENKGKLRALWNERQVLLREANA